MVFIVGRDSQAPIMKEATPFEKGRDLERAEHLSKRNKKGPSDFVWAAPNECKMKNEIWQVLSFIIHSFKSD